MSTLDDDTVGGDESDGWADPDADDLDWGDDGEDDAGEGDDDS